MKDLKQREAARSVAIEMALEGMRESQVQKELEELELHHLISPIEISVIVSKHRPKMKFWFPTYHLMSRLIGALVIVGCLLFLLHTARAYLSNEAGVTFSGEGIVYSVFALIGGLWLLFKPEDADTVIY